MWLDEGWIEEDWVHRLQSPNQDARPMGTVVDTLVVHCISLPERGRDPALITDLFLNRLDYHAHVSFGELIGLHVSSHFLIDRDGSITQFVSCEKRAWHAGISARWTAVISIIFQSVLNCWAIFIPHSSRLNMPA